MTEHAEFFSASFSVMKSNNSRRTSNNLLFKNNFINIIVQLSLFICIALAFYSELVNNNPIQSENAVSSLHSPSNNQFFFVNTLPIPKQHSLFQDNILEEKDFLIQTLNVNNSTHESEEGENLEWWEYVLYSIICSILILGAGLMSGFTLGLLSIDTMSLEILKTTGTDKEKMYANRLSPILKRHHLLLVTLLLWNAVCVEALPLFLDKIVPEWVAILLGVTAILMFGEIIPQAVISRYGIAIGGTLFWFVWILIFCAFIIAWPISKLLDFILGAEHGTLYQRTELKELVNIHYKSHDSRYHLSEEEAKILGGALDFSKMSVGQIMTKVDKVYMLDVNSKLDVDTMTAIWQAGHSRIPVFKGTKDNIVGMLYVKDLILINPDEVIPISTILTFYGREVLKVFPDTLCDEMLRIFKTGRTHIAIVHEVKEPESGGDPYYSVSGIVTLEDIIEEIIKDEIVDETDTFVDNTGKSIVPRNANASSILLKLERTHRLTPKQVIAVSSYLLKSISCLRLLPEDFIHKLLGKCPVIDIKKPGDHEPDILLYEKGKESDFFTLVLSGKLEVVFGEEKFTSEITAWGFVGEKALTKQNYIPDFDVSVVRDTSIVKISRKDFIEVLAQLSHQEESFFLPKEMEWLEPVLTNMKRNMTKENSNIKMINVSRNDSIGTLQNITISTPVDSFSKERGGSTLMSSPTMFNSGAKLQDIIEHEKIGGEELRPMQKKPSLGGLITPKTEEKESSIVEIELEENESKKKQKKIERKEMKTNLLQEHEEIGDDLV